MLMKRIGDEVNVNACMALPAAPQLALVSLIFEEEQTPAILSADPGVWGALLHQALLATVAG